MADDPPASRASLLVLAPDTEDARTWAAALEPTFPDATIHQLTSAEAADRMDLHRAQAVVTGMRLPDATAGALLSRLLTCRRDLPVVLVARPDELKSALLALDQGAADYVLTSGDYTAALPVIVQRAIGRWRSEQETQRLFERLHQSLAEVRQRNEQLEHTVTHLRSAAGTDPLTGLANRRAFGQALERRFAEARRYGRDLACLMIDLDAFKQLNDTMGHQLGDRVLATLGRVLEACCRRSDAAGRFGGDEFIVLLPETDITTAQQVAERVRAEFDRAMQAADSDACLSRRATLSLGLASLAQAGGATAEGLVACADEALYRAKQAGGNQLRTYQTQPRRHPQSPRVPDSA